MFTKNLLLAISLLITGAAIAQKNNYKVTKIFHIKSPGWWDYIRVNDGKVYVSHGTQVNILDEKSGDSVGVIPDTKGVHGIAFDNKLNRGFTSNGALNNVTVFDLKTNQIITQVSTGAGPDGIMYEPFTKYIITNDGHGKSLSFIDPSQNKLVDSVDLQGKPEEAVSDGKGKLFVNLEDKNEIAVIDLKNFKIIHRWSLAPGEGPSGLAMDTKTNRLFSACSDSKLLEVVDATNGKIIAKLPIGAGCDGTVFDDKNKLIFAPAGRDGNITVYKEKSANEYESEGIIETKKGARTIAIDQKNGSLFLPTAEFGAPDPQNPRRPQMLPGTFQVLVVNK
jgi:DNA-binding beta-propeller fold protein YncE